MQCSCMQGWMRHAVLKHYLRISPFIMSHAVNKGPYLQFLHEAWLDHVRGFVYRGIIGSGLPAHMWLIGQHFCFCFRFRKLGHRRHHTHNKAADRVDHLTCVHTHIACVFGQAVSKHQLRPDEQARCTNTPNRHEAAYCHPPSPLARTRFACTCVCLWYYTIQLLHVIALCQHSLLLV